jgi:hypothetical protein
MIAAPICYDTGVPRRCTNSPGRGHPRLDGGNVTKRTCACGCGDTPARWDAKYILGHRPPPTWDDFVRRFWNKVDVRGPDECWEWRGSRGSRKPRGYGQIWYDGRLRPAHYMSLVIAGRDPGELWGLHLCDNPPCVNPDHLYAGTAADNARDVNERSDWNHHKGERHFYSKLSDEDVREIRRLHSAGFSQSDIAQRFGITPQYVWQLSKRIWRASA